MKQQSQLFGFIVMAVFFASAGLSGVAHASTAGSTAYSPIGVQPNPALSGNVTWSSFNSTWAWNEYNNSTGVLNYIPANKSLYYANPIFVDPSNVVAPGTLQNDLVGTTAWNTTANWSVYNSSKGTAPTLKQNYLDGLKTIEITTNGSAQTGQTVADFKIPITSLPSTNLAFDYITVALSVNAPTGFTWGIQLYNGTTFGYGIAATNNSIETMGSPVSQSTSGSNMYLSFNLQNYQQASKYQTTFNESGTGAATEVELQINFDNPVSSSSQFVHANVTGLALTTTPLYLGQTDVNDMQQTATAFMNGAYLTSFVPNFKANVINGGYTAALSQQASNLENYTVSQAAINQNGFVEQVTYEFTFGLPSAPDLTYGAFNFTQVLNVPGNQYVSMDVNGLSYLKTYNQAQNGSTILIGSENPTSQISYLSIVQYSSAQWDGISAPPGLFSLQGIEFTWYELVGIIGTVLGLSGGAAYARKQKEPLREVNK